MTEGFRRSIDELMNALQSSGQRAEALRRAVRLGREEPALLAGLVAEVLRVRPAGAAFLDVLLSFLPGEAWPDLVAAAVEKLIWSQEHEAAAQVVRKAGFQVPSSTHPHLKSIFQLERRGQYGFEAAFHEARLEDVRFLFERAGIGDEDEQHLVCRALCETRLPEAFEFVRAKGYAAASTLLAVGFEEKERGFRRLYPERPLHLAFPQAYLDRLPNEVTQRDLGTSHFTWEPAPRSAATHRLGGMSGADCSICGKRVPRLLLLDPVPEGIGVTGLARLELSACLSCLGWEREILHYRHPRGLAEPFAEAQGATPKVARPPVHDGGSAPKPPAALAECDVALVDRGPRARFQDWTTRENLHRLGGHPVWIEDAEYPACPDCGARSSFLLELDSELPTTGDLAWLWGRGGIGYVFFCDPCKVSSVFWRCT